MSDTKISEAAIEAGVIVMQECISSFNRHNTHGYTRSVIEAALPHLHPHPAELAEQQVVELPPLPASRGFIQWHSPQAINQAHGFTSTQMQDYARAALAATGKQQVGEVESLPPEMRSSDSEYLDYLDGPKQVGEVQDK